MSTYDPRYSPGRFAAFAYDNFYPSGGMRDCVGRFETESEARAYLKKHYSTHDHTEVHDLWMLMSNPWRPHQS